MSNTITRLPYELKRERILQEYEFFSVVKTHTGAVARLSEVYGLQAETVERILRDGL